MESFPDAFLLSSLRSSCAANVDDGRVLACYEATIRDRKRLPILALLKDRSQPQQLLLACCTGVSFLKRATASV